MSPAVVVAPPNGASQLGNLRRSFLRRHLEQRPSIELLQYGTVTLIHKKLDSRIDSKPAPPHYEISMHVKKDMTTRVVTLHNASHDHLSRRVMSLAKNHRGGLARSWSGNIGHIQKDSLIDIVPSKLVDEDDEATPEQHGNVVTGSQQQHKRRCKPRRVSGEGNALRAMRNRCLRPKDCLLEGDIRNVRKFLLDKKLSQRPILPHRENVDSTQLVQEIHRYQELAKKGQGTTRRMRRHSDPDGRGMLLRTASLSSNGSLRRTPVCFMPSSA